jgi:methyltransferase (TIGR00027 family)
MEAGTPSRTAWAAACHRAAHQVLEQDRIFTDPLALRILGKGAGSVASEAQEEASQRRMRIFIAVRHRFAEDAVAAAIERGLRQVVVLGAGLDTWAYRSNLAGVRVFEVDHPATQAWKRQRLADAAIPLPDSLTFAPIDFQQQNLADGLAAAGFDCCQLTFFTWLGVVPYLTEEAVWSTLGFIGDLPNGAHVVFDYGDPPESLTPQMRAMHTRRAERVAALGEAWLTYFTADELRAKLTALGFSGIEDLGPQQIAARYFPHRAAHLPNKGGHIVHATTIGRAHGRRSA